MRITTLILFIIHAFAMQAQIGNEMKDAKISPPIRHEIGLNLFSIQNLHRDNSGKIAAEFHYPTGLFYKLHHNKHTLRFGIDLYFKKYDIEERGVMYYSRDVGKSQMGEVRLGYQTNFGSKKLRPFIGGDLVLSYQKSNGILGGYGDIIYWYTENSYVRKTTAVGLAPVVGVNYVLNQKLSLTAELNVNLSRVNELGHGKSFQLNFSPVRLLSLNYHF